MSDGFLHIAGVSKRFGDVAAVEDAELGIARGEFFSLLGPSGCGKTTLLRMIAGFEFPDEGEIYIDGARVTDEAPNRRPTNMVFQSYAIFPHLDVFDNIAYGLRRERLARPELTKRVEEALAMIKLEGFGQRRADQLSGGQRQRVALARALVCRPKVLLLDEPLGALDKRLREAMQIELRELQKSVGITFVFVTHDQEEALSMSDRIAVMSAGRVLQVATPRALYEGPNCREVADFIGTMNFFEGTIAWVEGDTVTADTGPAGRLRVANAPDFARKMGARVLLAIRPEKIVLALTGAGTAQSDNRLSGTLVSGAYLGERSHYQVQVEGLKEPVAVAAQNEGQDTAAHHAGAAVTLTWPADAMIVLPAE
jgi:spermidine/putrescine transport system ATP-binding protein/putrescine transport system ATP-binding protein